jgi:hypothetical protein
MTVEWRNNEDESEKNEEGVILYICCRCIVCEPNTHRVYVHNVFVAVSALCKHL